MPTASAPKDQIAAFRSDGVTAATGLRIAFFTDDFSRSFGFPNTRLLNMITEATPLREERPYAASVGLREVHYSRPGLTRWISPGSGPIRCVFQGPPVYGPQTIIVSGEQIFDGTTLLGSIPGTDMVRYAYSRAQIVLVASGVAYLYDGTTGNGFVPITSAVLGPVSDVVYLGRRFVYSMVGSDTIYWSEIDDAANIGGLNYATAESNPDPIIGLGVLDDELIIFGSRSCETWQINADADAPFAPIEGQGYQRGCIARDAIAFGDNALIWIGENRTVYRTKQKPEVISSPSIEDKLRQCANPSACNAFVVTFEQHEFYVLNIPGVGTFAYDFSRVGTTSGAYGNSYERGEWSEWASFGYNGFRGQCAFFNTGTVFLGDSATNDVWFMQVGTYTEGSNPLIRTASAFIKVEEGSPRCDNLVLHCVTGVGTTLGQGSLPIIEMRYSDDQGHTFSKWRPASLGVKGNYLDRAFWSRLGSMRAPGRLVEVRSSDPVNVALSHLELNASRPAD